MPSARDWDSLFSGMSRGTAQGLDMANSYQANKRANAANERAEDLHADTLTENMYRQQGMAMDIEEKRKTLQNSIDAYNAEATVNIGMNKALDNPTFYDAYGTNATTGYQAGTAKNTLSKLRDESESTPGQVSDRAAAIQATNQNKTEEQNVAKSLQRRGQTADVANVEASTANTWQNIAVSKYNIKERDADKAAMQLNFMMYNGQEVDKDDYVTMMVAGNPGMTAEEAETRWLATQAKPSQIREIRTKMKQQVANAKPEQQAGLMQEMARWEQVVMEQNLDGITAISRRAAQDGVFTQEEIASVAGAIENLGGVMPYGNGIDVQVTDQGFALKMLSDGQGPDTDMGVLPFDFLQTPGALDKLADYVRSSYQNTPASDIAGQEAAAALDAEGKQATAFQKTALGNYYGSMGAGGGRGASGSAQTTKTAIEYGMTNPPEGVETPEQLKVHEQAVINFTKAVPGVDPYQAVLMVNDAYEFGATIGTDGSLFTADGRIVPAADWARTYQAGR